MTLSQQQKDVALAAEIGKTKSFFYQQKAKWQLLRVPKSHLV
jgi:hypothetical protein